MRPVLASRPTEHVVAFYHSDDFVVEQVASFISEGLAANEHVIAIATALHWNAITARLDDSGMAYGRATSAGQLILIEADEALDAVTVSPHPRFVGSAIRFRHGSLTIGVVPLAVVHSANRRRTLTSCRKRRSALRTRAYR